MRKILLTAVFAAWALAGGGAAAQTRWQLPTAYPPQNFHTLNVVEFVNEVRQATSGRLDITVHPAATLLPLPQILRNVQTGAMQMGETLLNAHENEDAIFGADQVSFLVTSYAAARQLYERQKPLIDARFQRRGVRMLYSVPWPPQALYTARAINSIEDMRGLVFRSYGPSSARFGEIVGLQVTTVQAAELSQALATGRVNSMITSSVTGVDSRVWESPVRFYYSIDAWLSRNAVIVNEAAFNGLDQATRDLVLRAAASAETRGWRMSEEAWQRGVETLRQNGVRIEAPSAQLTRQLREVGVRLAADWEGRAGDEGRALLAPFKQ
jgi:TRAP-type transport system periplasmic protein